MTREVAINILSGIRADNLNLADAYTKDKYEALGMAIQVLEQEPKTGHWINNHNGTFECDKCGCKHSKSKWCPCCGAKMD